MESLLGATDKAVIITNDAVQFSAGVNLNYIMNFANEGKRLKRYQK